MIRSLAVAALGVSLLPGLAVAQCNEADKTALEALDKAWGEATQRGDRSAMSSFLADNFMAVNIAGTVDRATTIANAVTAAELARTTPQAVTVADYYMITCTPTTATITHRNVTPPAAGSTSGPAYSRSVHFLEKRGNRWVAVSTTGHPLSDQQQLAYMELDWNAAAKRRDAGWVERNYSSFASDVSSRTGALETKAQAIESMRTDKRTLQSLELSGLNTRVEGDVAVVTGVNHVKGTDADGKPMDMRVRFTDVFVQKDGRWQVWATQGTQIR